MFTDWVQTERMIPQDQNINYFLPEVVYKLYQTPAYGDLLGQTLFMTGSNLPKRLGQRQYCDFRVNDFLYR